MKMPEKWQAIKKHLHEFNEVAIDPSELKEMLSLMKNMAEALQYYTNIDLTVNFGAPPQFNKYFHNRANTVLKKFQSWK